MLSIKNLSVIIGVSAVVGMIVGFAAVGISKVVG